MKTQFEIHIKDELLSPELKDYGKMIELVTEFKGVFHSGNAYALIGECGEGGWGISYILAGKEHYSKGEILIDGKVSTLTQLKLTGWYVGETNLSSKLFKKTSILNLIKNGLKESQRQMSANEVIELFGLSKDRLDLKLNELSWEKWRASIAIGYAYGKRVFCFPWFNTSWINDLILNTGIHRCIDILKKDGAIIILPTQREDSVNFIVDEIIFLNNPRNVPSLRAKEFVENFQK